MASSVAELLQPQYILRVISRIRQGSTPLGRWLGFHSINFNEDTGRAFRPNEGRTNVTGELGGDNKIKGDVRVVSYRIFDRTRVPGKARAPGMGPATVARNPIGQNQVACARFHQKIPINYEFLGNLSPVVGPNSQVDPGGEDYLMKQNEHLAEQFNIDIELMAAGMMRNSLYFIFIGDDIYPSFTAPGTAPWPANSIGFQVNFQIPSTNTGQGANQLGTNSAGGNVIDQTWYNNGTLIFSQIQAIKAAYAQLTGAPLTDVWINSLLWPYIIGNTQIRNAAGSSNTPFAEYDIGIDGGMGGQGEGLENTYHSILRVDPTIKWHMVDDVVVQGQTDVDPTYATAPSGATLSKYIPDGLAIFTNNKVKEWCQLYEGSEYVVENPGMPGVKRQGMYFWKEYTTQPSNIDLIGLMNAVPILYVPKIIAPLTVGF